MSKATVIETPKYATLLRHGTDGLSDRELRAFSPSIFAIEPHEDVSEKYGFLPSTTIVKAMRDEGFVPTEAKQYTRRKNVERMPWTKHMLRFRTAGDKPQVVGDCVPEIVFVNSHDRSSRAELYGGLFRLVCGNGLIVSESQFVAPVIIRHTKNPVEHLLVNVENIIKQHKRIAEHVKEMKSVVLTQRQQNELADAAIALRGTRRRGLLLPESVLQVRRKEDAGDTLWTVFNRVQENITKGGVAGVTANGRHVQTRPVQSMENDMRINSALWELAMAAIGKARASAAKASKTAKV